MTVGENKETVAKSDEDPLAFLEELWSCGTICSEEKGTVSEVVV